MKSYAARLARRAYSLTGHVVMKGFVSIVPILLFACSARGTSTDPIASSAPAHILICCYPTASNKNRNINELLPLLMVSNIGYCSAEGTHDPRCEPTLPVQLTQIQFLRHARTPQQHIIICTTGQLVHVFYVFTAAAPKTLAHLASRRPQCQHPKDIKRLPAAHAPKLTVPTNHLTCSSHTSPPAGATNWRRNSMQHQQRIARSRRADARRRPPANPMPTRAAFLSSALATASNAAQ